MRAGGLLAYLEGREPEFDQASAPSLERTCSQDG